MSLPAERPGRRPRQARHGGLPVLGRRAQRERRAARPPGRAEGPRRRLRPADRHLRLQPADLAGQGRPAPRHLLLRPQRRRRPDRRALRVRLRRAVRRRRRDLRARLRVPVLRAAGDHPEAARPVRRPDRVDARGRAARRRSPSCSSTTRTPRRPPTSSRSGSASSGSRPSTTRPTPRTRSNFDTIANAIKQADPDLVINGAIAGDGIALSARSRRSASPRRCSTSSTHRPTRRTRRRSARPTPRGSSPTSRGARRRRTRPTRSSWRATPSSSAPPPSEDAANSYTAGQVLAAAVEAVGELDQAADRRLVARQHRRDDRRSPQLGRDGTTRRATCSSASSRTVRIEIVAPESAATTDDVIWSSRIGSERSETVTLFLQTLILGLLVGGVYALMSSGFSLVFGVMRIINLSHAAMIVLAAFLTWWVWDRTGLDPLAGRRAGHAGDVRRRVAALQGGHRAGPPDRPRAGDGGVVRRRRRGRRRDVADLGHRGPLGDPDYFNQSFEVGSLAVPKAQLYACLGARGDPGRALVALLRGTFLGRAIRACATNRDSAALAGINVERTMAQMFAIGAATTGFAGAALVGALPVRPGLPLRVDRTGALRRDPRRARQPAGRRLGRPSSAWARPSPRRTSTCRWATAVPYVLIIAILLLRPQGLLGDRARADAVHS